MNQQQKSSTQKSNFNAKLSSFLTDCLQFGSLKGFKHFEVYLRGKEELLLRVLNNNNNNNKNVEPTIPVSIQKTSSLSGKPSLMLSQRLRKGIFEESSNIVPASPCDREMEKDLTKTAFLIAGYARYERPFAWLRSNHQRFLAATMSIVSLDNANNSGDVAMKPDDPLKLETIRSWKESQHIKIYHVVEEILQLVFLSSPVKNPFAIDHEHFNTLSLNVSVIQTAAMINFLGKLLQNEDKPCANRESVENDLKQLSTRHIQEMAQLSSHGHLECLKDYQAL